MATNIAQLAFDETGAGLAVVMREPGTSSVTILEPSVIEFQDHGVMLDFSGTRYFVPWQNILVIQQSI